MTMQRILITALSAWYLRASGRAVWLRAAYVVTHSEVGRRWSASSSVKPVDG